MSPSHSRRNAGSPRNVDPARTTPVINANLLRIVLTSGGAVLLMFDGPVEVDMDNPPTTWAINGTTSLQPGGFNFGDSVYLFVNGPVDQGNPVVLAADDPAARTPGGGYVNAAAMAISDL